MEDNKLISKSFLWMCIGLLVTFVTGFGVASNESIIVIIIGIKSKKIVYFKAFFCFLFMLSI